MFIHSSIEIYKRKSIIDKVFNNADKLTDKSKTCVSLLMNSLRISILAHKVDQAQSSHIVIIDITRMQGQSEEAYQGYISQNGEKISICLIMLKSLLCID